MADVCLMPGCELIARDTHYCDLHRCTWCGGGAAGMAKDQDGNRFCSQNCKDHHSRLTVTKN